MKRSECAEVVRGMAAKWPHQPLSDSALAQFYADLQEFPFEQVQAAVEVLYRDGREFPPNGAQVRKELLALASDLPRWSEVWAALLNATGTYGSYAQLEAIEALRAFHPLAGQLASEIGFRELCLSTDSATTLEAQCRNKWDGLVREYERNGALRGLPSSGLKQIERANGPHKLDFRKALTP